MKMASVNGKVGHVIYAVTFFYFICTLPPADSVSQKTFSFKRVNATEGQISYPRSEYGDCVYDSLRQMTTCMRNHPYDVITSAWRQTPENMSYLAVNCLQQRMYVSNHRQCICKDRTMAANPHKQTQTDSYVFCQLDAIYPTMLKPLVNLEVLDLSHNHLFRICPDCLEDIKKLKLLSLSNNPIQSFFDGILCRVPSLEILLLQDMPLTAFPQNLFNCGDDFVSTLRIIDMSHSKISALSPGDFDQLSYLGLLDLSYNEILDLPEDPFIGLTSLETLDLSGNHISHLPGSFCSDMTNLTRFVIRDNELLSFNCSIFYMCSGLEYIDFSHGTISAIHGTPCQITSLRHLDLSENLLSQIPTKLVQGVSNVEYIDLSRNVLQDIHNEAFHNMDNLQLLNLSLNQFSKIDQHFMKSSQHMQRLKTLDLKDNDIEVIKDGSFMHLRSVEELDLSGNALMSVHLHTFTGLGSVEKLRLNNNNISHIANGSFSMMSKLIELDLSSNGIDRTNIDFPSSLRILNVNNNMIDKLRTINQLTNLETLYLKGNSLSILSGPDFKDMMNLRFLDISENRLTSLGDTAFMYLAKLEMLNLSANGLKLNLSNDIFPESKLLLKLDLSHNYITYIGNVFNGGHLSSLKILDLSFNNINSIETALNSENRTVALRSLNMQSCGIRVVMKNAFRHMDSLEYVNLQNNLITHMPLFEARLGAMFHFRRNPLICSCDMNWILKRWLDVGSMEKMSTYDYNVDVCEVYPSLTTRHVRKLQTVDFLCPITSSCPDSCQCFVLKDGGPVYMTTCSHNLAAVPTSLPGDSEYIYLDGNNFGSLTIISSGSCHAKRLFLNSSYITDIGENIFRNFESMLQIDLSFNQLKLLPSSIFHGLDNLIDINLRHNILEHLNSGLFNNLPSLQNIDVSFNKLHYIAPETLYELDNLNIFRWIRLAGNPLVCACPNYEFRQWMERSYNRVYDRRKVLCEGNEIRRVDTETFACPDKFPASIKTAIVSICVVSALLPLIVLLVYCRREVVAVCYTRIVPLFTRQQKERHHHGAPYLYDVVVLYDTFDPKCSWWVQKSLLPKLTEGRRKYKLYVPKPQTDSHQTTVLNIQNSRSTIALVTNTFHQNRFALDCFRYSVTQEINNDNDHHVIVVTWGFIDNRNLPYCLKHFVDHGKVLPITATLFWDKLIQKLPNTITKNLLNDASRRDVNGNCGYEENQL